MSRHAWTALVIVTTCGGFGLGLAVGRLTPREFEITSEPRVTSQRSLPQPDDVRTLLATQDNLRSNLQDKDRRILELETTLAELRDRLSEGLNPAQEAWRHVRRRWARKKKLRNKILRWRDKVAYAEGLEELAALLESENKDDLLTGWETLDSLVQAYVPDVDKFRPQFLQAIKHEDSRVRWAAFENARLFCSGEEIQDIMFSFAEDPSLGHRYQLADDILWYARREGPRREEAAALFTELLQDEDASLRSHARYALVRRGSAAEAESLLMEMSRDPKHAGAVQRWASRANTISGTLAERLAELYEELPPNHRDLEWTTRKLSDDARPYASRLWVRFLRESIAPAPRVGALDTLRRIGDPSVIPELEAIAQSEDAEGIEDDLARTIEYLRNPPKRAR